MTPQLFLSFFFFSNLEDFIVDDDCFSEEEDVFYCGTSNQIKECSDKENMPSPSCPGWTSVQYKSLHGVSTM